MFLSKCRSWFTGMVKGARRSRPAVRRPFRPRFEALEGRELLSTFTVFNTKDNPTNPDQGSLRWAINQANTNPGPDLINFNPTDGGGSVNLGATPLPDITDAVAIEGASPGGSVLKVDGLTRSFPVLTLRADNCTVENLEIRDGLEGIQVLSSHNVLQHDTFSGAWYSAIHVTHSDNTIANNYIWSSGTGIWIDGPSSGTAVQRNVLQANNINGNLGDGILVSGKASNNTIRRDPSLFGQSNSIYNNLQAGIHLSGSGVTGNIVQGNDILSNQGSGVLIDGGAANNTVGGFKTEWIYAGFLAQSMKVSAGNSIHSNGGAGVRVDGGSGNTIQQNSIYGNAQGGIVLANGGNRSLAAPSLFVISGGGGTNLTGVLSGQPNTTYTIELFTSPRGGTQGQTFLKSVQVTTTTWGVVVFSIWLPGAGSTVGRPDYSVYTATATDPLGNTSAFSAGVAVSY